MVLQLYILLQRVSFFCAIFWICSFIVGNYNITRMKGTHGCYHVPLTKNISCTFKTIKAAAEFCERKTNEDQMKDTMDAIVDLADKMIKEKEEKKK